MKIGVDLKSRMPNGRPAFFAAHGAPLGIYPTGACFALLRTPLVVRPAGTPASFHAVLSRFLKFSVRKNKEVAKLEACPFGNATGQ
jgi:hypothetical protein